MKTICWIFWTIIYWCSPEAKDFHAYWLKDCRTRNPWWKFRPYIYRSKHGKMWQIYFKDEQCYSKTVNITIRCDLTISQETGEVIGIDLWDEELAKYNVKKEVSNA